LAEVQPQHRKKLLAVSLGLAVVAVWVFVYGTRQKGFNWAFFQSTVAGLDPQWLLTSLFFSYGTYVVRALRWAVLIRPLRPHPGFRNLLSATVIGFSAVTALGRAAEMVRPYLIANKEQVPFSSQVAAWVVERLYDVLIALAVFGFALSQVQGSGVALGPTLSWVLQVGGVVIGLGAAGCLGILLAMRFRSEQIQRGILKALKFLTAYRFAKAEKFVTGFLDGVRCTKSQSATAKLIAYTLIEWLLIAACYACVLKAFGSVVHFSFIDVLILMGFVSFGSLVQLPAVGGGAQMTAVLVLTEIFAVPIEVATGLSLLLWFISFVAILPVGTLLAFHEGLTWARIREAEGTTLA
jgi:glycosyltransferase 2 family protein